MFRSSSIEILTCLAFETRGDWLGWVDPGSHPVRLFIVCYWKDDLWFGDYCSPIHFFATQINSHLPLIRLVKNIKNENPSAFWRAVGVAKPVQGMPELVTDS